MKDATYFAEIACREMTPDEVVKFRPLIYNLFLQAQAEAFKHSADLIEDSTNCPVDDFSRAVCAAFLRKSASATHPIYGIPTASNEEPKMDIPEGGLPGGAPPAGFGGVPALPPAA